MTQPPPTEALIASVALLPSDIKKRIVELAADIDKPLDQLIFEAMNLSLRFYGRGWELPEIEIPFNREFDDEPEE